MEETRLTMLCLLFNASLLFSKSLTTVSAIPKTYDSHHMSIEPKTLKISFMLRINFSFDFVKCSVAVPRYLLNSIAGNIGRNEKIINNTEIAGLR